jgi:multisubunit Na+/H+ antiporter MnhF subunit
MSTWLLVVVGALLVAAAVASWRALSPSGLGDRAVAFDVLTSVITCGLIVSAAATGTGLFLELALVLGLLGFLASVTVARFIERRGE